MTYKDVIQDIKKLIGLELHSIRPGASITILEVDDEKNCLILRTAQGLTRSRPLSEIELIWNEMSKCAAVHVEGVLHGSGTSRNQPETIFANLPYVEWLKVNNKKHIAYVGKNSHPYGTLRQMSAIDAEAIAQNVSKQSNASKAKTVIVSADIGKTVSALTNSMPGKLSTIEKGVYSFEGVGVEILILLSSQTDLLPGCYTVVSKGQTSSSRVVDICDEEYYVIAESGIRILVKK